MMSAIRKDRVNRQPAGGRLLLPTTVAAAIAMLVACGGGDSGSAGTPPFSQQPQAAALQGTAASGAFMAGAQVTVYDADGKVVGSKAADDSGRYSFDVSNGKAPFAIVARGSGSAATYVSVLASKPAGTTATVNVTPLTTAIAALLAEGDPLALTRPGVLGSKAGSEQVQRAVAVLRQVLQNVSAEAGLDPAQFDPIATPLTRQGEGADAILDVIKVTLTGNGARLVNTGVAVGTDAGEAQVTLTPDALGKPQAALPRPTVKTRAADFEAMRAALQACFAAGPDARVGSGGPLGSCKSAFAADYLNSSYMVLEDFYGLFTDKDMTGARFGTPQIVFHAANAQNQPTALLRLPYVRADGGTDHITRLATNRAAAGAAADWQLTGNQRSYDATVTPRLTRITELNPAAGVVSRYESGLRIVFNPSRGLGNQAQVVRVTGPGLPAAGVVLARSRVCGTFSYMAVQNTVGSLVYAADDPISAGKGIQTTGQNTNGVVLAAAAMHDGETVDWKRIATSAGYPAAPLSDAQIAALPEFGRYRFEVWNRPASGSYYYDMLPAQPDTTFTVMPASGALPPVRLAQLSWNSIAASSLGFVTAGSDKSGPQASVDIAWSNDVAGEPVNQASAFGLSAASPLPLRMFAQSAGVARGVTSMAVRPDRTQSAIGGNCPPGTSFTAFSNAGDQRNLEIRSSTADDALKYVRVVGTVR